MAFRWIPRQIGARALGKVEVPSAKPKVLYDILTGQEFDIVENSEVLPDAKLVAESNQAAKALDFFTDMIVEKASSQTVERRLKSLSRSATLKQKKQKQALRLAVWGEFSW